MGTRRGERWRGRRGAKGLAGPAAGIGRVVGRRVRRRGESSARRRSGGSVGKEWGGNGEGNPLERGEVHAFQVGNPPATVCRPRFPALAEKVRRMRRISSLSLLLFFTSSLYLSVFFSISSDSGNVIFKILDSRIFRICMRTKNGKFNERSDK